MCWNLTEKNHSNGDLKLTFYDKIQSKTLHRAKTSDISEEQIFVIITPCALTNNTNYSMHQCWSNWACSIFSWTLTTKLDIVSSQTTWTKTAL